MVELNAKKNIQIKRIKALAEIKTRDKRPEIIWLLRHYKDLSITEGEKLNISNYLETQFNLLKNDYPTSTGKEALKSGFVLSPQYGLFRIYYIEGEPILKRTVVIGFDPIEATKYFEAFQPLENFQDLEAIWNSWQKSYDEKDFTVEFEHTMSNNPMIIEEDPLPATLTIDTPPDGSSTWKIQSEGEIFIHKESFTEFNLNSNLQHLLSNWDPKKCCILIKFKDIKYPIEKDSFVTSRAFENCSLIINDNIDNGNFSVTLTNIPIRPKDFDEAKEWLLDLLLDFLKKKKQYCSTKTLLDAQEMILKKTPLQELYPDLGVQQYNHFIAYFKENADYEYIQEIIVADDLNY